MSRVLRDLATSRADQVDKLRRAAAESPAHAGLFDAVAQAMESIGPDLDITEAFRWTPVQVHAVRLAELVLAGRL
jgi:hypothetical protein